MELAELKPIVTALVLPPAGPLLLAAAGLALWLRSTAPAVRRGRIRARVATLLVAVGLATLWLLSCNAVAVWLAQRVLPQVQAVTPAQLATVEAIVVLGGGVAPGAPEYGGLAQPGGHTLERLRYGIWLARQSGRPVAFAGGVGWASAGTGIASEGAVAQRVAREEFGVALRWVDDRSRDTAENAARMAELLRADGVPLRVAVVTDAWHMPRALRHFERAGFAPLAAPIGFAQWRHRPLLEWTPSAQGLADSRQVLREWLALRVTP